MHFSSTAILTLVVSPFLVLAQSNPFSVPSGGLNATAGQPLTLDWTPTTNGTITLILRSGNASDLDDGTIIASNLSNSGAYTWTPATTITQGSDYTVEIVDDSDTSNTNYTPDFTIDSTNKVASSTSEVTLGAAATASTSSQSSATASVTSSTQTASSATATASVTSSTQTASSATATASSAVSSSMKTSTTGTAGSTTSATATVATQTGAGAPRATVMAGVMGMMALAALAL